MLLGFTSLFLWMWTLFQDSFVYLGYVDAQAGLPYPWTTATVVFALVFCFVGVVSRWLEFTFLDARVLVLLAVTMLACGACVIWSSEALADARLSSALTVVASIMLGASTPLLYLELARTYLGHRLVRETMI